MGTHRSDPSSTGGSEALHYKSRRSDQGHRGVFGSSLHLSHRLVVRCKWLPRTRSGQTGRSVFVGLWTPDNGGGRIYCFPHSQPRRSEGGKLAGPSDDGKLPRQTARPAQIPVVVDSANPKPIREYFLS